MKTLYCDKCGKYLGEIKKGKIKNNTILICNECNTNSNIKEDNIFPNIFNELFNKCN